MNIGYPQYRCTTCSTFKFPCLIHACQKQIENVCIRMVSSLLKAYIRPAMHMPRNQSRCIWQPLQTSDCLDVYEKDQYPGVFTIQPPQSQRPFKVYCDSGWAVIQRRTNGIMSFSTPFRSVLYAYALIVQDVRLCAYNNIIIFCYLHSCHGFYFCTKNLKQEAYRHWRSPEYPIYEVKILTRLSSDCYPCLLLFNVLKLKKKNS